jgi:hypothetical protein
VQLWTPAGILGCGIRLSSPVTAFYKRESQERNFPCDWKERESSRCYPAHRLTVRDLARNMAAHGINHILQIERLLRDDGRT